jgi:hypothetical protein
MKVLNGFFSAALVMALSVPVTAVYAQDQDQDRLQDRDQTMDQMRDQMRDRDGQPIAGYNLMTEQERQQFRDRMRSMNSMEERQAFRQQHHEQMMERARARGVELEKLPPTAAGQPKGNGKGKGMGGGMGNDAMGGGQPWKQKSSGGGNK